MCSTMFVCMHYYSELQNVHIFSVFRDTRQFMLKASFLVCPWKLSSEKSVQLVDE